MHIGDVHAGWARPESGASLVVHGRGIESGECFRYPGPSARDVRAQPAVNQRTGGPARAVDAVRRPGEELDAGRQTT